MRARADAALKREFPRLLGVMRGGCGMSVAYGEELAGSGLAGEESVTGEYLA